MLKELKLSDQQANTILEASWPGNRLPPENVFCFGICHTIIGNTGEINAPIKEWKWINFDDCPKLLDVLYEIVPKNSPRAVFESLQRRVHESHYETQGVFTLSKYPQRIKKIINVLGFQDQNTSNNIEYQTVILAFDLQTALPIAVENMLLMESTARILLEPKELTAQLKKQLDAAHSALENLQKYYMGRKEDIEKAVVDLIELEESPNMLRLFLPECGDNRAYLKEITPTNTSASKCTPMLPNDLLYENSLANILLDDPELNKNIDLATGEFTINFESSRTESSTISFNKFLELANRFKEKFTDTSNLNPARNRAVDHYRRYLESELYQIFDSYSGWWIESFRIWQYKEAKIGFITRCLNLMDYNLEEESLESCLKKHKLIPIIPSYLRKSIGSKIVK